MAHCHSSAGATLCAATDVIIAVSLAWKFWKMMCQSSPERETRRFVIVPYANLPSTALTVDIVSSAEY
jgi:hypothetical protein